MKKIAALILSSCILISGCAKSHIQMDVISSYSITSDNWSELYIDVIADKDTISDPDTCSAEIIQHILSDDFPSTRFLFDLHGYPNKVAVDVYTSEKKHQEVEKAYSFEYVTKFNVENLDRQNNIKDNPEEFQIQYK